MHVEVHVVKCSRMFSSTGIHFQETQISTVHVQPYLDHVSMWSVSEGLLLSCIPPPHSHD